MKIHCAIGTEVPKSGSSFKAPCGTEIKHLEFKFNSDSAKVEDLGNCYRCRRKLKVPTGKYVLYGFCEAQEALTDQ